MSPDELLFRNVDVDERDTVDTWGVEAIITALERGSLRHWRRIAEAVYRDPWGPVARELEQAIDSVQPYGVAEGMTRMLARSRATRAAEEKEVVAARLRQMLADSGLTATEFASRLGTSPARLSTYLSGKVTPSAAFIVRASSAVSPANRHS